jgi:PKHD-type hydroxylase
MKVLTHSGLFPVETVNRWNQLSQTINPVEGKIGLNKTPNINARSCEVRWVTFSKNPDLYRNIANEILPVIDAESLTFRTEIYRALEIQHSTYYQGDHYVRHSDIDMKSTGNNSTQRKISIVVMLSDPSQYEGGNLVIENQTIPKTLGTIVMFPPYMFHSVEKITKGVRRSLVIWAHGPAWR